MTIISKVVNINPLLKSIILTLIEYNNPIKIVKSGRPPKCSTEKYIDAIFYVLKTGICWEYLIGYPVKGNTIAKKHANWSDKGIFKLAWIIAVNIYAEFKIDFNELFIDASHIKNYGGVELIGRNHYDRFRTSTKLSVIVDNNGVPIGITMDKGNSHDITLVIDTINSITVDMFSTEYLIADKGYISESLTKELITTYKLKLITDKRRTKEEIQIEKLKIAELNKLKRKLKKENSELIKIIDEIKNNKYDENLLKHKKTIQNSIKKLVKEKKLKEKRPKKRGRKSATQLQLDKRVISEHTFSWFKKYTRLLIRRDNNYTNFEGFVFFGAANIVFQKIENII